MRGKNDMLYIYRDKKITPQNGCKSYTLSMFLFVYFNINEV